MDAGLGEERIFRLDRIAGARMLTGSFDPPAGIDPAERVVTAFATAAYRYEVTVWIQGTEERIRTRFPVSLATVSDPAGEGGAGVGDAAQSGSGADGWLRVDIRAERLEWLPPLLAALDLPFEIERPDELRELVAALADRLADSARRDASARRRSGS
jgi:predicted DNA-binding transcriptional regulator YafY